MLADAGQDEGEIARLRAAVQPSTSARLAKLCHSWLIVGRRSSLSIMESLAASTLLGSGSRPALTAPSMAVASSASQFSSWASGRRVTVSRQASRWVSRSRALSKQRR